MRVLEISKKSTKFILKLGEKQRKQIVLKINSLTLHPFPNDSIKLLGADSFYRVDIGEYRIIYQANSDFLKVFIVEKRNDDDVYRKFSRLI